MVARCASILYKKNIRLRFCTFKYTLKLIKQSVCYIQLNIIINMTHRWTHVCLRKRPLTLILLPLRVVAERTLTSYVGSSGFLSRQIKKCKIFLCICGEVKQYDEGGIILGNTRLTHLQIKQFQNTVEIMSGQ